MASSTVPLRSLPPYASRRTSRSSSGPVVCTMAERRSSIPKLEPFSRSKIDRRIPDSSFIQKSENNLTEYCSILEGDESYSCWRAYFELKDLEMEMPKEDVEEFIRQAGGVKTMIDCIHGLTAMQKKDKPKAAQPVSPLALEEEKERAFHVPDGLPKSQEELEEEERCRMPDSPFTRLLRTKGTHPVWYSQAPDHEYD